MEARLVIGQCALTACVFAMVAMLPSPTSAQIFGGFPAPAYGMHSGYVQAVPQGMPRSSAGSLGSRSGRLIQSANNRSRPSSARAVAHSENFIVFASDTAWAEEVSNAAEKYRSELAKYWLGYELPAWGQRCTLHVRSSPQLQASGETRFTLFPGGVGDWNMIVAGTRERVLDSVLPHEITHTVLASHFGPSGKYVPRWADEGACTTVEHEAEKSKHRSLLQRFLRTGQGLAFNTMFSLKEYPPNVLPLYAQGHSAVQFLLDQGGPQKFIKFLELGLQTEAWSAALAKYYKYESIGDFQTQWNRWLYDGSPTDLLAYSPLLKSQSGGSALLASSNRGVLATPSIGAADTVVGNTGAAETDIPVAVAQASSRAAAPTSDNWYVRRLIDVSGGPATPVPAHNTKVIASLQDTGGSPNQRQATARPPSTTSVGIQVLDWGDSPRISGQSQPIIR